MISQADGGEPVRGDDDLAWPVRFESEEIRRLVRELGLTVTATSPLHGLVDASELVLGQQLPNPCRAHPAGFVRALWVLTAPRHLVLVRLGPDRTKLLRFLSDGEFIVRFDIGRDGGMVSEPWPHDHFAELICALAEPSEDGDPAATTTVSRRFLEALSSLYEAGLFGGADATVPRDVAEDAVGALVAGGASAADLLLALEADGVLAVGETGIRPNATWQTEHAYLAVEAALKMRAIDLEDARQGRQREKALAVLGTEDRRLVVVPPESRRDALIELLPVTRATVTAGVRQLLSPALAPSAGPIVDYDGAPGSWFRRPPEDDAGDVALPAWQLAALADLAPGDADAAPPMLLAPGATVDFVIGDRRRTCYARHVLALSADDAAEWTLDGSLVQWRPLTQDQVSARAEALIPSSGAVTAPRQVELTDAGFESIVVGCDETGVAGIPEALRALATDPEARWCSVRATYVAGGALRGCVLLIATSVSGGTWRFEQSADGHTAASVAVGEIRAELIAALTPKG